MPRKVEQTAADKKLGMTVGEVEVFLGQLPDNRDPATPVRAQVTVRGRLKSLSVELP